MNLPGDIARLRPFVARHALQDQQLRRGQAGFPGQLLGMHIDGTGNFAKRDKQIVVLVHELMQYRVLATCPASCAAHRFTPKPEVMIDYWGRFIYGGLMVAGDPPLLILHGDQDDVVSNTFAQSIQTEAASKSIPYSFYTVA